MTVKVCKAIYSNANLIIEALHWSGDIVESVVHTRQIVKKKKLKLLSYSLQLNLEQFY